LASSFLTPKKLKDHSLKRDDLPIRNSMLVFGKTSGHLHHLTG
jgi:hypothetical protein